MTFHSIKSLYETRRKRATGDYPDDWYGFYTWAVRLPGDNPNDRARIYRAAAEIHWYKSMRPYYKVWPVMADALLKLSLDISFDQIKVPEISLCVRFPVGKEPMVGGFPLQLVLFSNYMGGDNRIVPDASLFSLHMETSKCQFSHAFSASELADISKPSQSIEEWVYFANKDADAKGSGGADDPEFEYAGMADIMLRAGMRVAMNCILLSRDPSFIEPDVLNKDRDKWEATKDKKYVVKAKRRGVVGWNVGREFESIPHYRRPHLGLRWTEKGRAVPKIVPIRGTIVHPDKMKEVPTGYITPDGVEVEP